MKKIATIVGLEFLACVSHAAYIESEVDPSAYITKNGYDIAWASPCAVSPTDTCAPLDLSFQSQYGWSTMSYEMFTTLQISATDFVFAGANAKKINGWGDTTTGATVQSTYSYYVSITPPLDDVAVATPWFSSIYKHIDWSDGVADNWSFSDINGSFYSDSLVYRITESSKVPEPASIALVGIGLACMVASCRRRTVGC